MTQYLQKYNDIMEAYRNGEFGDECLTMHKILDKAGEPDLFKKMSLNDLQYLIDHSFGISRQMFCNIKSLREKIENDS